MSNSNSENSQQQGSGNRPAQTFRYGAIKCTIWRNDSRNGPFYSTVVTRSYKDGEDWKESNSFGQEDLPTAAKAMLDAHSWVQAQLAKDRPAPSSQAETQEQPKQRQRTGSREPARV